MIKEDYIIEIKYSDKNDIYGDSVTYLYSIEFNGNVSVTGRMLDAYGYSDCEEAKQVSSAIQTILDLKTQYSTTNVVKRKIELTEITPDSAVDGESIA